MEENVVPICANCKYKSDNFTCACKQKEEDIKNNAYKKGEVYCNYFWSITGTGRSHV